MGNAALRHVVRPLVVAALLVPLLTHCGLIGGGADVPRPPRCPDMTVDAMDKYDFAAEMKIQPPVSAKLRPGIDAALVLGKLAEDVDTNLRQACAAYLTDLGAKAVDPKAGDPCTALVQAISDARAKLGSEVVIAVDFAPPVCASSLDLMNVCATQCDSNVTAQSVKATCDPGALEGACDAQCTGACDTTAPAACKGSCSGTCDAKIRGTCSGLCSGKCDGKPTKKGGASCHGICDGTCDAAAEGLCTGGCTGSCRLSVASSCAGTCTGGCSAEWKSSSCSGEIHAPKMTAECKAKCDALATSGATCAPRPVIVRISGQTDDDAARAFKTAAEKNLPAFGRVAVSLAERVPGLVAEVKDVSDTVASAVTASIVNPVVAGQVAACFAKPFADVTTAGASLQGNIELAIRVKASMASGGPGGAAVLVTKPGG